MGDRCPLCGGDAGVQPSDDGFSCLLCGGPRIVVDAKIARSGRERPHLERARGLQKSRATWGVLAGVAGAAGAVSLVVSGLAAAFFHLGDTGGELAAAFTLGPLLFSAFGFSKVRAASRSVAAAMSDAEVAVAEDLARARGTPLEGPELARVLHVTPTRAEELSASLQVESFLAAPEAAPAPRMRVDAGDAPADADGDVEAEKLQRR